ncbi:APC family permease [Nocardia pseudovaccinii]|uniref:APC family permease n=1 Tax=Nocardia pseudovaccinii TaxID=189540 RepID=UPI003D911135
MRARFPIDQFISAQNTAAESAELTFATSTFRHAPRFQSPNNRTDLVGKNQENSMSDKANTSASADVATGSHPKGPAHRLRGNMRTPQLVFNALAFNAPLAALIGGVPLVIGLGGSIGAPLLFAGLGALMLLFSVGYTLMARLIPKAGAYYTFVTAGMGRPLGLGASFLAITAYFAGLSYPLIILGITLNKLVQDHGGPNISWWVWTLIVAGVVGILGYVNIDVSTRVLLILVVIEVIVVVAYDLVVFGTGGQAHHVTFGSFNPATLGSGGALIGLVLAMSMFLGFESVVVYRDEARDPERSVPRATYITVAAITIFYTIGSWAIILAFGEDQAAATIGADPATAFLTSIQSYLGMVIYDISSLLFVTSVLASVTAMHNVVARYLFNLSSDAVLPRSLSTPHHRHGSPHRASMLISAVTLAFIVIITVSGSDIVTVYGTLAGMTSYALIVLFFLASIAVAAYLLRTRPAGITFWKRTIAPVAAALAMTVALILVTTHIELLTGSESLTGVLIFGVAGVILLGIVLALVLRRNRPEVYQQIGSQI